MRIFSMIALLVMLGPIVSDASAWEECSYDAWVRVVRSDGSYEDIVPTSFSWTTADTIFLQPGDTIFTDGVFHDFLCTPGPMTCTLVKDHFYVDTEPISWSWKITEPGYYTLHSSTTDETVVLRFFVNSAPVAQLAARAFLGGPFDPTTMLMNDDLRALDQIGPTGNVYEPLHGLYEYDDRWIMDIAVLDDHGPNSIVDYVHVELRDASDPTIINAQAVALIQRDGDIVDMDGVSPLRIIIPPGNYHVSILHRNHLGIMSADAIPLGNGVASIDLSDPNTPTYGTTARKLVNGAACMWPGNARTVYFIQAVSYAGAYNDRDAILARIGGSIPTQTYVGVHALDEDLNMDGVVKYTGANNDRDLILQTIDGTVPTAVRTEQIPW
ncbi:MAG: hypothetical protein H6595_08665 [Flavobacteriales bacterium]|nr:hypothetical protein [Flavobacteriales bacterium]MCB9167538.1 hypothetical protein [Flavobacteriales bacterium]